MISRFTSAALLTLALTIPASAAAQSARDGQTLEGMVVDPQSLPVLGAQVAIGNVRGSFRSAAKSGAQPFRFEGLPAGRYEIRVDAPGFASKIETVDIGTTAPLTVEIRLETAA